MRPWRSHRRERPGQAHTSERTCQAHSEGPQPPGNPNTLSDSCHKHNVTEARREQLRILQAQRIATMCVQYFACAKCNCARIPNSDVKESKLQQMQ
eukprot:6396598-Pyramimonas_sp.AAC.1